LPQSSSPRQPAAAPAVTVVTAGYFEFLVPAVYCQLCIACIESTVESLARMVRIGRIVNVPEKGAEAVAGLSNDS